MLTLAAALSVQSPFTNNAYKDTDCVAARRNLGKITVGAGIPNMFRIWMIGVFSVFQWCLVTKWPPFVLFSNGPYHWKTELLASLDHFYKKENNFKTFCIPMFGIQARMIYNIQLVIQAMTWKMENSNTKPVCHPNPLCTVLFYCNLRFKSILLSSVWFKSLVVSRDTRSYQRKDKRTC